MNNELKRGQSRYTRREKMLAALYLSELVHEAPNVKQIFESGEFTNEEVKLFEELSEKYERFVKLVNENLADNWEFMRLAALERAILVWGAFELTFNDAGLVINELILYAKNFIPGLAYQYLNKVLDNISKTYVKTKQNPSTTTSE